MNKAKLIKEAKKLGFTAHIENYKSDGTEIYSEYVILAKDDDEECNTIRVHSYTMFTSRYIVYTEMLCLIVKIQKQLQKNNYFLSN